MSEVRFTGRLVDSPCCLIVEGSALAPHMERLFKAMHQEIPKSKRILELNYSHPLIAALNALVDVPEEQENLKEFSRVLWDQALLAEGSPVKDQAAFAKSIAKLLLSAAKKN